MMYLALTAAFFLLINIYFKLAAHYNIIDKPNERSSHTSITIRGGGIVFVIAALVALCLDFQAFGIPAIGVIIIGTISFLDDIYSLPNKVRLLFHIAAVSLMFYYLAVFTTLPVYVIAAFYILVIGIINAYNFMDGINGITGLYSLVTLCALQYVNMERVPFINEDMIWLPVLACVVFLFYNFRKKAACFAGDVGSVTIAFWIVTLLLKLILFTGEWKYLLLLSVYGVDAVLTILHRLSLKQNIFKAHRLHFYQIMANERKVPHLMVASLYAFVQGVIDVFVVGNQHSLPLNIGLVCVPLILIYVIFKPQLMHKIAA
ncbi:MraY family glycosyltransferase [Chitinophaga sp. 22321]|uniref:Glycosyltransferase family 4 protein n=1 Tax=Chitinophaga hostae TaxID=2831022 RepID=A0ABS5J320_9BACT|nr:glycosyltransferase family 4 protein [Chitinophaga hostae]MBS0028827.1 glycosyltransferase family 4 protein [Chitinophaga hostae]